MKRIIRSGFFFSAIFLLAFTACKDTIHDPQPEGVDLRQIPYQPISYFPLIPEGYPALEQPADNSMTSDGIWLGRKLFYDPILSRDSTISCSSCHLPSGGFTDNKAFSEGVGGFTTRSSMSLIDVGFQFHGLFWDGRSPHLEDQALHPVEDMIEMGESWKNVAAKLRNHPVYPTDFRKAFGISNSYEIDSTLVAKALAQFQRTLISSGNSRYDQFIRGEIFPTDREYNGYLMFFDLDQAVPDAECAHCHNPPLFTIPDFLNNGIQSAPGFTDFSDNGRGAVTGQMVQNGLFKPGTLRNLSFTAPYMHDGRFQTIDEVIEHYNSGGHYSPNKNSLLYPLNLSETEKADLKAFLLMLTDSTAITNPAYQSPF